MTSTTGRFGAGRGRGTGSVWAALRHAAGWPGRVRRARRLMHQLAGLDARELRDIGLTPQDLRDAGATPFDSDPSLILRQRVDERRRRRRAHVANCNKA